MWWGKYHIYIQPYHTHSYSSHTFYLLANNILVENPKHIFYTLSQLWGSLTHSTPPTCTQQSHHLLANSIYVGNQKQISYALSQFCGQGEWPAGTCLHQHLHPVLYFVFGGAVVLKRNWFSVKFFWTLNFFQKIWVLKFYLCNHNASIIN